ncbi:MAG: hypothetical protein JNL19_03805 [Burkholderiales bacterium]|nr:hypothetical protein [Burkholderiales bacterium]
MPLPKRLRMLAVFLAGALLAAHASAQAVTVVEYYNRVLDAYFITSRTAEINALDLGVDFERTGASFSATAGSQANAANSICRYYISLTSPYTSSHFYGLQATDCQLVAQTNPAGFTYEGIDFVVGQKVGAICPLATPVAVYRSFRPAAGGRTPNHRYTVSQASYDKMAAAGWTQEGIAFCVSAATDAAAVWPPATTGLYAGTTKYAVGMLDGYTVRDVPHARDIPVLIQYPLNAGRSKRPVIVYSHGGDKNADGKYIGNDWGAALAEVGYIVVQMSHPPRTSAEQSALLAEFGYPPLTEDQAKMTEANLDRPRDTIAVLNALPTIEAAYPQAQGLFDYDRVGLAAHSRGTYSVRAALCARVDLGIDPDYSFRAVSRFNTPLAIVPKALMAASPQGTDRPWFKLDTWRECTTPDLTLTGVNDFSETTVPANRVQGYQLMPPGNKYLLYIDHVGAIHNTFNLKENSPVFDPILIAGGRAFFDAHLRNSLIGKAYLSSGRTEAHSSGVATISQR